MIKEAPYGTAYGAEITKYTLENKNGFAVSVINYGATVTNIIFDGRDLVLGYDNLEAYKSYKGFLGATVGRYANRICGGRVKIGENEFLLTQNNGENHIHGGYVGFDKQNWTVTAATAGDEPSISLNHIFEDMEEGYPGELDVTVTFTVTAQNSLKIEYKAISTEDTVINLTNHSYFNLSGGNIFETELCMKAPFYTPVDEKLIPTGEIASVKGTEFDFLKPRKIERDYDNNFCLEGEADEIKISAYSRESDIEMLVKTSEPAVQLYTGAFLNSPEGKGGVPNIKNAGFCLETQHYPDSPNHENFPSTLLKKGESFYSFTEYIFRKR
ncbi:MAG: galactose mutarotase [Oscillospiraceae bacterium]|nr:galactose mutarotase [Oscillospiraceae bacterium]